MNTTTEHIVTIFKNIKETDTPFYRKVESVLERIKDGASKELIQKIRSESNKSARNELKKDLPSICFSGEFNKRSDVSLKKHSGLITLDLDGYAKQKRMIEDKKKFSKNKYVFSVFISPSGKGLKVLVRIPRDPKNHVGYFNALKNHFKSEFFDTTSKNISRVCYESFDPLIYINPKAEEWTQVEETQYKEIVRGQGINTIPINEEDKITSNLIKWHSKNFPMVDGMRNNNAFTLAMAFNEYGVSETMATIVLNKYASSSFPIGEINKTIKNAYAHRDKYNTKYFEDEEKVNDIQQRLRRGESKEDIRQQLSDSMLNDDLIDSVIETAEENNSIKFWTKNSKGIIKMLPLIFKKFLEANGFYKYCPDDQNTYVFVKVTNNLIDNTSEKEIKDFILGHLIEMDDMTIYNYFADQTRIFKEEFLTLLDTIEIYFIEDTVDTSYLYYQNCAIKITKDEVVPIDYLELDGYVWKNHIIPRDYNACELGKGDYRTFIANVSDKNPQRIKSMESTTGFLLHGYKNISYCPAVILNDEIISDQANGGTGKGIFFQAIDAIKKVATIDGKAFAFEKSFPYQTVSADTQIILFDDVKQGFQFERLFSVVSEGLTLEKKNKDAIKIPFHKSPKISITTNHIIKGTGNSFIRRKWELELTQYYTEVQTPLEEFGRYLFGGWDQDEWCQFDNYMIYCLQLYLGKGLIKSVLKNQKIKLFQADTDEIFTEWCGLLGDQKNPLLKINEKIYTNYLYGDFVTMNPDYGQFGKRKLSRTEFYKWLKSYAMYTQGVEPILDRDSVGKYIIIKVKPTKKEAAQSTLEF